MTSTPQQAGLAHGAGDDRADRARRKIMVVVAALLLLWWLLWLGAAPLFDVDEGAFAEASREMLASNDWGHTTLNGADRFDKPILVYWLQATSLAAFGSNEFAVRLPSALCAWGWCLAAWAFAARRWGARVGMAAGVMVATSLGPLLIGRAATADALLNVLLVLTMFDLWRFCESSAAHPEGPVPAHAQRVLRRGFAWAGLGLLAKGPVAVLVPIGAFVVWAAAGRNKNDWRTLGRMLSDRWAWALGTVIAVPWYAYAWWRHGPAFINGFFMRHNIDRFRGPLEGHGGSMAYYLVFLPLLMLPWTPLLAPLGAAAWRKWRSGALASETRFLLAWAAFVIVFFSLSGTKLPHYVLYGYTPFALLAARKLVSGPVSGLCSKAVFLASAGLVALGASSAALAAAAAARWGDAYWRLLLDPATLPAAPSLLFAALALLGIGAAALLAQLRPERGVAALLGAAAVAGLWMSAQVVPWWAEALHGPVRVLAAEARERGWPLVQWRLHQPSAGFYRGQAAPLRGPQPGEAAIVRVDRLGAPGSDRPPALTLIRQERAMALVIAGPSENR